jgi:hypothetical protein
MPAPQIPNTPSTVDIEVFKCDACGCSKNDTDYDRPLSSLEGEVHISSSKELQFTNLEVSLQG